MNSWEGISYNSMPGKIYNGNGSRELFSHDGVGCVR
jgi:hypothetical protein